VIFKGKTTRQRKTIGQETNKKCRLPTNATQEIILGLSDQMCAGCWKRFHLEFGAEEKKEIRAGRKKFETAKQKIFQFNFVPEICRIK
jgi:hypothetical protein